MASFSPPDSDPLPPAPPPLPPGAAGPSYLADAAAQVSNSTVISGRKGPVAAGGRPVVASSRGTAAAAARPSADATPLLLFMLRGKDGDRISWSERFPPADFCCRAAAPLAGRGHCRGRCSPCGREVSLLLCGTNKTRRVQAEAARWSGLSVVSRAEKTRGRCSV